MPDYNLGRAHGTVEIDYDGRGVEAAKRDVDDLGKRTADSGQKVQTANAQMQAAYDNLSAAVRKLQGDVDRQTTAETVAKSKVEAAEKSLQAVKANTASTTKDIKDAEREVQAAQKKSVEVSRQLAQSSEALRTSRARLASIPTKSLVPGTSQNDLNILERFRQHLANIDKQTRITSSGLNTFTGRTKLLVGGVALATPGIAGLAVSLVALTGVAGVAAGALAAVGAVAATLAVGTSGISDVFKAASADMKSAGSSAASSAKAQQAAARQIEQAQHSLADAEENLVRVREDAARAAVQAERAIISAQRDLVNAQRDAARAQTALTKARQEATRQLEDMRLALVGGALDERQATLDVADAQAELNKVMADPTATQRDRDQAILNLEKQKYALEQAQVANKRLGQDAADAAAKGVAGSDAVVNAQDAVRSANQQVEDAVQAVADAQDAARQQQVDSARAISDAVQGITDAQQALEDAYASAAEAAAGGASKTADAMKNISPNARALVSEILAQRDAWEAVKFSVQDRLFAGLAADVAPFASKWLPLLEEGLGGIADGFNGIIKDVVAFLQTQEALNNVQQIFGNTAEAVQRLRGFVTDLLAAFLDIAAVGSDFLPDLATDAAGAAAGFRDMISEARQSGQLREWMQSGIDAASTLWQLLKNIGSIVVTVFSAFDQEGGGALNTLTKLTGQIDKFLKSAEGQDALHALGRALAAIGGAYGKVFISALESIGKILVAVEPFITAFADAAGTYLAAAIQAITPILQGLAEVIGFLGPALGPVVAGIYAANKAVSAAKVVWQALNGVMSTNPFIQIAAIIIALVLLIIQNWDSISEYLSGIWNDITTQATAIWTGIRDFFVGIWNDITTQFNNAITAIRDFFVGIAQDISNQWNSFWSGVRDFFVGIGQDIKTQVGNFIDSVVSFFRELPGRVWNFVKGLPDRFLSLGKDIVSGILRGLGNLASALWNKLKDAVSAAWDSVLDFFGINSPSRLAMWAGEMITKGFAGGIESGTKQVVDAAQAMANAAGAVSIPGFDPNSPSGMAFGMGTSQADPVGLSLPAVRSATAPATSNTTVYVGAVTQQVAGNLDPTKPVQWRSAMANLKDGLNKLGNDYK
jgi:phage-related protein